MKEKELREAAKCAMCNKLIGHTGLPMFWRVTLERHGVDLNAVRRQDGLTAMLGGRAELAGVMGADEEMTVPLMEPITVTLCETCAMDNVNVFVLAGME
jgi:hypothetical protein